MKNEYRVRRAGEESQFQKMDADTLVIFSLPSRTEGAGGEVDPRGVCTVRLLEVMCTSHNNLVGEIEKLKKRRMLGALEQTHGSAPTTTTVAPRAPGKAKGRTLKDFEPVDTTLAAVHVQAARQAEAEAEAAIPVPVTTYHTSSVMLRRTLVTYNREDLLPLLSTCCQQSLDYSTGHNLDFNFHKVEDGLVRTVFSGLQMINLHILFFNFTGELRGAGTLAQLQYSMPQEEIVSGLQQDILGEIDTKSKISRLSQILESAIAFIIALSGMSGAASVTSADTLEHFILDILMVHPEEWKEAATPTISRTVKLCHLKSLYFLLEGASGGSRLDVLGDNYKVKLSDEQRDLLRKVRLFYGGGGGKPLCFTPGLAAGCTALGPCDAAAGDV